MSHQNLGQVTLLVSGSWNLESFSKKTSSYKECFSVITAAYSPQVSQIFKECFVGEWTEQEAASHSETQGLCALIFNDNLEEFAQIQDIISMAFECGALGFFLESIGKSYSIHFWNDLMVLENKPLDNLVQVFILPIWVKGRLYSMGMNFFGEFDLSIQCEKKDDEQKVTLLLDFCAEVLSIDDLDLSQKFVTALAETYTIKQEDAPQFFNQSGYEAVGMYRFVKQI